MSIWDYIKQPVLEKTDLILEETNIENSKKNLYESEIEKIEKERNEFKFKEHETLPIPPSPLNFNTGFIFGSIF